MALAKINSSELRVNWTALWNASMLNVWTWANQIVQLDWDWKLPAIDWTAITWVTKPADLWTVATLDVWTWANQIVQLDSDWKLPAIDWSWLTWISLSDPSWVTWADAITNMMSLTQDEYDNIETPDASTFYLITD